MAFKCGHTYITSMSTDANYVKLYSRPLACKSWDCPDCRRKKAAKYAKRTLDIFKGVEKVRFLTVTFDHHLGIEKTWDEAAKCWNRFRTALVKKYGKTKFVRVLEPQKSGYPHYHILIDRYIPSSWLAREIKKAGFGKIYQIRLLSGRDAFYYILKYLKKAWPSTTGTFHAKRIKARRYNTSREPSSTYSGKGVYKLISIDGDRAAAISCHHRITEILAGLEVLYINGSQSSSFICNSYYNLFASGYRSRENPFSHIQAEVTLADMVQAQLHHVVPVKPKTTPGAKSWPSLCDEAYRRGLI